MHVVFRLCRTYICTEIPYHIAKVLLATLAPMMGVLFFPRNFVIGPQCLGEGVVIPITN